jgi:hypothetical protein
MLQVKDYLLQPDNLKFLIQQSAAIDCPIEPSDKMTVAYSMYHNLTAVGFWHTFGEKKNTHTDNRVFALLGTRKANFVV